MDRCRRFSGTHIETKPSEPDQDGSQKDQGRVVRLPMSRLAVVLPFAENERVGQGRPSRGDVNGTASREVQRGQVVEPAVAVPRPACNGTIDDGRPKEAENQARKHIASLKGPAHNNHHGTGTEEQLIQAIHDFWKDGGAGRRSSHDVHHAERSEASDERASFAVESQRIPPEHPLKRRSKSREFPHPILHYRKDVTYTATTIKDWKRRANADFLRARPP